jgi:hypothetical protein
MREVRFFHNCTIIVFKADHLLGAVLYNWKSHLLFSVCTINWLAVAWSLLHQLVWQLIIPGNTIQRTQTPSLYSLHCKCISDSVVFRHIEQLILCCLCSSEWKKCQYQSVSSYFTLRFGADFMETYYFKVYVQMYALLFVEVVRVYHFLM